LGRIIRQSFAQSLGLIEELVAGERGKIPHLRKDDGVEIYLQATPARRMGQRAERDEQINCELGLEGFGGWG
jgi:hypothetical protein